MFISVVVCTHNQDNFQDLIQSVDSLLAQSYKEREIIVVFDGSPELSGKFLARPEYGRSVSIVQLRDNRGISEARNAGIKIARGDVIAFIDDDAVAEKTWLECLAATYESSNAIAVGGKVLPVWEGDRPVYLPEELFWLIGITHDGFAGDRISEVRNTFGPNMSFKKEVFESVGSFRRELGFVGAGASLLQAEEAELALRMKRAFRQGMLYNPAAVVYHRVPTRKTKRKTLLRRAFYQGYSKAIIARQKITGDALATDLGYLKQVLLHFIPRRLRLILHRHEMARVSLLILVTVSVGLGFLWGLTGAAARGPAAPRSGQAS